MLTSAMTSIESLPDELWLLFMSFPSPIPLCRALFGLNSRVNALLHATLPRLVLNTSGHLFDRIHYADWLQLVNSEEEWCQWLLSSVQNVRLGKVFLDQLLLEAIDRRIQREAVYSLTITPFTSLRCLCIRYVARFGIDIIDFILPLTTTLRDFRLIFDDSVSDNLYFKNLNRITDHRLSFERMAFDAINGACGSEDEQHGALSQILGFV